MPLLDQKLPGGAGSYDRIFGMNSGAYISEIMRSGIQSVDSGQMEAGRAVGFKFWDKHDKDRDPAGCKKYSPDVGK